MKLSDAFYSILSSSEYNPEQYVQEITLASGNATDLAGMRENIQIWADDTNGLLKKNVYKNYTQFIETAKEISYLESEMYQLSHMLTEQKLLMASLLEISLTGEKTTSSKNKDAETKEEETKVNLTSLLEKVEGCASIMEVPGRYLVYNGDVIEIDPVTLAQLQRLHFFLLNDSLMLAVWLPNRRGPIRYKFQALYELEGLAVVNVRDMPNMKNGFKLLMFPDTRFFVCDTPKAKKEWLEAIENTKKTITNTETQKRECLGERLSRDSSFDSSNPFLEDTRGSVDYDEQPDWLTELPEDLDVCIAQRDFEEAVNLIERGQEYLRSANWLYGVKEMRARIDQRIKLLAEVLMNELKVSPDKSLQGGPRAVRRAVSVLIKLGKSAQACDLFLKHRSAILKYSTKQLKIEGVTTLYIKRLCSVFFSHLMDTCKEFERAFPSHHCCHSGLIVWATAELNNFTVHFSRQVFTPQASIANVAECVSLASSHCEQMTECGLDLCFLLNSLLRTEVERIMQETREKLLEAIKLRASEDKWRPMNFQNRAGLTKFLEDTAEIGITSMHTFVYDECWISLTSNTIYFSKAFLNFVDDVLKMHTPETHALIVEIIVDIFRTHLKHVSASLNNDKFKTEIKFIQKNATFLLDTILTLAEHRYEERLKHSCPPLAELRRELPSLQLNSKSIGAYSSMSSYA